MIMPCGAENRFVAKTCCEEEPEPVAERRGGSWPRGAALGGAVFVWPVRAHLAGMDGQPRFSNACRSQPQAGPDAGESDTEASGSLGSRPHLNLRGGSACTGPPAARRGRRGISTPASGQ